MVKIAGRVVENKDKYFLQKTILKCIDAVKKQIGQCEQIITFHLLPPVYYTLFGNIRLLSRKTDRYN